MHDEISTKGNEGNEEELKIFVVHPSPGLQTVSA
jgi:hypothetical protein